MAVGELSARAGLQVFLECARFGLVAEGDGDLQIPRRKFGGVWNMAAVVILEALFEVCGAAGVDLLWVGLTYEAIDVREAGSCHVCQPMRWLACQP